MNAVRNDAGEVWSTDDVVAVAMWDIAGGEPGPRSGSDLWTTVLATLQGFNQNLVRASLSLGANPLTTFFRITLPVIAPGVISGALFAFATSFDEVVVTLFLAGPDQVTLPRQMFTGIRENITPTIAAVATLLILFTTTLLLTLEWLRGRRR